MDNSESNHDLNNNYRNQTRPNIDISLAQIQEEVLEHQKPKNNSQSKKEYPKNEPGQSMVSNEGPVREGDKESDFY